MSGDGTLVDGQTSGEYDVHPPIPEHSPTEPLRPAPIDLEAYYAQRIDEFKLHKQASKTQTEAENPYTTLHNNIIALPHYQSGIDEYPPDRTFSKLDRLRHKALLTEAKFKGARNPHELHNLIITLESTVRKKVKEKITINKRLTEEEQADIIADYRAKGYSVPIHTFFIHDTHSSFIIEKEHAVNVQRKDLSSLQQLTDTCPDAVAALTMLLEVGVKIKPHEIKNLGKLTDLLSAPHGMDVIRFLHTVNNWQFLTLGNVSENPLFNDFVELAHSETFTTDYPLEMAEKMHVISRRLQKDINTTELEEYRNLIADDEQFTFLTLLLSQSSTYIETSIPVLGIVKALKENGSLPHLLIMAQNGLLRIHDIFHDHDPNNGDRYRVDTKYIDEMLDKPGVKDYIADPEKQEFAAFIDHITGREETPKHIRPSSAFMYNELFENRNEIMYLYDLIYSDKTSKESLKSANQVSITVDLDVIKLLLQNTPKLRKALSPEFRSFVHSLQNQGVTLKTSYFYYPVFDDLNPWSDNRPSLAENLCDIQDIVQMLGKDSLQSLVESIDKPSSDVKQRLQYYIQLAHYPDIKKILQLLNDTDQVPPLNDLGLPDLGKLKDITFMPLMQASILTHVPPDQRNSWVRGVLSLPQVTQSDIETGIQKEGTVKPETFDRIHALSIAFESIDAHFDIGVAGQLKFAITTYAGDVTDVYVNDEPTHILAKHLINIGDFSTLHTILTEDILRTFDEGNQVNLKVWRDYPDTTRNYIIKVYPSFPYVHIENLNSFLKVAKAIDAIEQSNSKELIRIKEEVVAQLMHVENPDLYVQRIIDVFERNNLPFVGKVYRVFEILYPPTQLSRTFGDNSHLSPVLSRATNTERYSIMYADLLKTTIDSANTSLYGFLQAIQEGAQALEMIDETGVEALDMTENSGVRSTIIRFLNRLDALYASSHYGNSGEWAGMDSQDIAHRIQNIKAQFGLRPDQPLLKRITALFLRPAGYSSIEQVLQRMDSVKAQSHQRNVAWYHESMDTNNGRMTVEPGDLLKGADHRFTESILTHGALAGEFLGASAQSDRTPFDTDTAMVLPNSPHELQEIVKSSAAAGYGTMILIVKDRGQFHRSDTDVKPTQVQQKYELFRSGVVGEQHYGIRTGIASTEIDGIIMKEGWETNKGNLEKMYFDIVQNGMYIPVMDHSGAVLFTPDMFESYKVQYEKLRDILQQETFNPKAFIETLKESPFLQHLYEGHVGVWEGYKLDEHTLMVMGQYEKYFAERWQSSLISKNGFRTLLALHDLGKPLAVAETGTTSQQHEYTMKFLPRILEGVGFSSKEMDTMIAIVNNDTLGGYIQGKIDIENAVQDFKNTAADAGVPVLELFKLVQMYFTCDAGSYTVDAGGKESLDRLFVFTPAVEAEEPRKASATFSAEVQAKIDRLNERLAA